MLVLSRKTGERIHIGNGVELVVLETKGRRVRLGFQAPPEVAILRHEALPPNPQRRGVETESSSPCQFVGG